MRLHEVMKKRNVLMLKSALTKYTVNYLLLWPIESIAASSIEYTNFTDDLLKTYFMHGFCELDLAPDLIR